jgi:hypothetical protein
MVELSQLEKSIGPVAGWRDRRACTGRRSTGLDSLRSASKDRGFAFEGHTSDLRPPFLIRLASRASLPPLGSHDQWF